MRKFRFLFATSLLILAAPPLHAQSGFGRAVAVAGEDVLIGESANQSSSGVVYVYRRVGGAWNETAQIVAADAADADGFGAALAVDGSTMLVSRAPRGEPGRVLVFQRAASGTWTQTGELTADSIGPQDGFGGSLSLAGDMALVGAAGPQGRRGPRGAAPTTAGTVHVFQRGANGNWSHTGIVAVGDLQPGDGFGRAMAGNGTHLLVGAPGQGTGTGAVYAFQHDGSTWRETAKLTGSGTEARSGFGSAIALSGSSAIIGSPGAGGTGAAFAFGHDATTGEWTEQSRLAAFDGETRHQFGASLTFAGDAVWIGAPGAAGGGRAYVFTRDAATGDWTGATKLTAGGTEGRDQFSGTVAIGGSVAVAGLPGDDFGAGTAVIFERGDMGWSEQAKVFSEVKGIDPVLGDQIDCTEGEAHVFDCGDIDLVAFLPVHAVGGDRGVRVNDVWGWTDAATGREYALIGMTNAASFVDITDPFNPVYLGKLPMHEGARPSTWRDIKVYADHAYIVSDGAGPHGIQVFDLHQLRDVRSPVTFTETAHYDGIASAHNIVINEETGFAYSVGSSGGGETCGGGLHMVNVQDPRNPRFAGCFSDPATGRRNTGYSHDAQCVIYRGPDAEHAGKEICMGANETALSIADVSDKANPVALARASYPNVGYTHQGWLSEDHRYFFMNDELDELARTFVGTRTLIWDVTDLDDPLLVKEYLSENQASDHNLYIRDDLMYQANYRSGLRVFNIADPENPVPVGFFDTVPYGEDVPSMGGAWSNYPFFDSGVIIVASGNEGLFLVKRKRPEIIP